MFKAIAIFIGIIVGLQMLAIMLPSIISLVVMLVSGIFSFIGSIINLLFSLVVPLFSFIFDLIGKLFVGLWDLVMSFFSLLFNFKYAAPILLYPVRLLLAAISVLGVIAIFTRVKTNYVRVPLMVVALIWLINLLDPTNGTTSTFIVKYMWQLIIGFSVIYYSPKLYRKFIK